MAVFRSHRDVDPVGPVDPAVQRLVAAARDTSGEVDTVALEAAIVAYRQAGASPAVAMEPPPTAPTTRRHRLARAFAATTIGTKVIVGVATAAALGGIGVGVAATSGRSPQPSTPPSVTGSAVPSSAAPSGTASGSATGSASSTASPTPSSSDSLSGSTPPPSGSTSPSDTGGASPTSTPRLPTFPEIPPPAT